MKVVHIESGLGNQMLSYCEYLAIKKMNPDDDIYIENIIYDIPEANGVICQWNGYELERIFGIKAPNVKSLFDDKQWAEIISDIRDSRFWERNWNYPVHFTKAFAKQGVELQNIRGDFESPGWPLMVMPTNPSLSRRIKNRLDRNLLYIYAKKYYQGLKQKQVIDYSKELFLTNDSDIFTGQRLSFKLINSGIERIEHEIRSAFVFPDIADNKNKAMLNYINSCNSVAIHARRGDMLGYNYSYYVTGYFKRAVKYIRENAENPIFFIFCDPGSIQWAKDNANILGLSFKHDKIHFIDWNKGTDSYRDMQLMVACKHQIVTNSSFGWWATWLNTNPNKITCSPDSSISTTHHF